MRWTNVATAFYLLGCHLLLAASSPPPLKIAYFVPHDRAAIPGYQARIDRVMTEVQRFYRQGMEANGYGAKTFVLERNPQGLLQVYLVQGQSPMRQYGRNDAGKVRQEVKAALAPQGVDLDRETVVIFQVLLDWQDGKATEVGPYVGGGDHQAGTAWVYDDALLDPRQLGSQAPGGYYHRSCSVGEFNSHYIGGVAHELGHAFGLPHVAGPHSERRRSLMGDGNHTYGQELRGEGAGTYLHPASAMKLARHLHFAGPPAHTRQRARCQLSALEPRSEPARLTLSGSLSTTPLAHGVIAYLDAAAIPDDYDAIGWTAPVDDQGRFALAIGDLRPGSYQLRLTVCLENGASQNFPFDLAVPPGGQPDTSGLLASFLLGQATDAFSRQDVTALEAVAQRLSQESSGADQVRRQVMHLRKLLASAPQPKPLESLPASVTRVAVSSLQFRQASVGWGQPLRNQVLREEHASCLINVGGVFQENGLYAHAPAQHVLALNQGWKRFRTGYGLQDGHAGSVVFVVRGDGRELFRSPLIKDQKLREISLELPGTQLLELLVEDGGNGNASDWAVWVDPVLER